MIAALVVLVLAAPPEPADVVRGHYAQVQAALSSGDKAAIARRVVGAIDALLDFPTFGAATLPGRWAAMTPRDRERFLAAFRALVERQFVERLASDRDVVLAVGKSQNPKRVHTTVSGRRNAFDLDLLFEGGRVVDLFIDGQSQADGYARAFERTLRSRGLDGLIEKMARP